MKPSHFGLFSVLSALTIFVSTALAAQFPAPITGNDAKMLFEVASDTGEPDAPGPVTLSAGCHYTKGKSGFELAFCDSEIGFINPPARETLSGILLSNRVPQPAGSGRYFIGVSYECSKDKDAYKCVLQDLSP